VLCLFLNVPDEEWVEMKELSELAATVGGAPPEKQSEVASAFMRKGLELVATRRVTPHATSPDDQAVLRERPDAIPTAVEELLHDELAFPKAEIVDLQRKPNRHLTFGIGPHICIGAPLARMELRLVLEDVLERTTGFALAGEPTRVEGLESGFTVLPLRVAA
jgi:hypothetical protein